MTETGLSVGRQSRFGSSWNRAGAGVAGIRRFGVGRRQRACAALLASPPRSRARAGGAPGQEMVELALLLPVLLVIAAGVVDLGRLFHAYITITNAAREGARYATFDPLDSPGITAATKAEAVDSGIVITDGMIAITCPSGCGSGQAVRVTISYPFELVIAYVFPDPNLTLNAAAEMMVP